MFVCVCVWERGSLAKAFTVGWIALPLVWALEARAFQIWNLPWSFRILMLLSFLNINLLTEESPLYISFSQSTVFSFVERFSYSATWEYELPVMSQNLFVIWAHRKVIFTFFIFNGYYVLLFFFSLLDNLPYFGLWFVYFIETSLLYHKCHLSSAAWLEEYIFNGSRQEVLLCWHLI